MVASVVRIYVVVEVTVCKFVYVLVGECCSALFIEVQ